MSIDNYCGKCLANEGAYCGECGGCVQCCECEPDSKDE